MSCLIEDGIRPLVSALNELDFAGTIYSCEGHFGRTQNEKFLPTAYVTFGVTDASRFGGLYDRIRELDSALQTAGLRVTYDCILGRYTLSIWPEASIREPSRKRAIIDSVVSQLSAVVLKYAQRPSAGAAGEEDAKGRDILPCGKSVPPCMLVIPRKALICPFIE